MTGHANEIALVRQLKRENATLEREISSLKSGNGGGNSGDMETVDAKIAAAEARVDTKFAELRGDLKNFATKSTVWQAAATIIAVVLAVIAFGGDRFDAGVGLADKQVAQSQRDQQQDDAVKRIEGKIDQLIAGQRPR